MCAPFSVTKAAISIGDDLSTGESIESAEEIQDTGIEIDHIQIYMSKVSHGIAQMDVINPEIMRVTRAFQTFQHSFAALRVGCDGDFYHKSCQSNKITTFWSHSWHGGHWKKILTLITLYNGTAAVSLGLLMALVMMLLFSFGQLPGFDRGFYIESVRWSTWSVCSGPMNRVDFKDFPPQLIGMWMIIQRCWDILG